MKKDRSSKVIEILALVVATIGLSIGFAAYSTSIDIVENGHVKPGNDEFKIVFSSNEDNYNDNVVVGLATNGATAGKAVVVDRPCGTIANLKAYFTEPGQTVTYIFYSHNRGGYDAYLKTITYSNVEGKNSYKFCGVGAGSEATRVLVDRACEGINLSVAVGDTINTTGSMTRIVGHRLPMGKVEPIRVTIEYAVDSERSDGVFFVEFGNVILTYVSTAKYNAR